MDIYCTTCGEPWDIDFVLHEADPEDFAREGGVIYRCMCCRENKDVALSNELTERLDLIRRVGPSFGDDVDGLAAFLEDLEVIDAK